MAFYKVTVTVESKFQNPSIFSSLSAGMASVSRKNSEDPLMCFICKKVFTDPVTPLCGHTFCNICINKHWDQSKRYNCPVCKEKFRSRPKLKTNTCLYEMVSELKKKRKRRNDAEPETSESNRKVKFQKKHQPNMEERTCPEHGKPFIGLFCRDDSQLICDLVKVKDCVFITSYKYAV
uniref:RING-type domain-containing protein n=1 Tax=Neogobius melanostomus TaxID=47308 RepID=A0A8C6URU1_9GOBI